MQGEVDSNTLMMIEYNNNKNFGVSSSTSKILNNGQMKDLNGETITNIPLMESMIHNRRCVSSSINEAEKSGE